MLPDQLKIKDTKFSFEITFRINKIIDQSQKQIQKQNFSTDEIQNLAKNAINEIRKKLTELGRPLPAPKTKGPKIAKVRDEITTEEQEEVEEQDDEEEEQVDEEAAEEEAAEEEEDEEEEEEEEEQEEIISINSDADDEDDSNYTQEQSISILDDSYQ